MVRAFAEAVAEARDTLNAIERAEDAVAALALALKLDEAYGEAKTRAGALDFDDLIEHAQASAAEIRSRALGALQARRRPRSHPDR